jgi:broad specificity phosphatase PhoE
LHRIARTILSTKSIIHNAGETEWTINGRCTGKSEIPLTANGVKQVQGASEMLVGSGKLIDPSKIAHIFCSPRQRAKTTLSMLLDETQRDTLSKEGKVTYTEDIAEWDYGEYEGLKPPEIRALRKERGFNTWDIWTEGCEGGE